MSFTAALPRQWTLLIVGVMLVACSSPKRESSAPSPSPTPIVAATPSATPTPVPVAQAPKTPRAPGLIGTGGTYRRVFPASKQADGKVGAIVAGRDMTPEGYGHLDVLPTNSEGAPVTLTTAPTADFASVVMSTSSPAVAFLTDLDPKTGQGTLRLADLQAVPPKAIAVPGGGKAISDSLTFGTTGRKLLYLSEYNPEIGTGRLMWWDGGESSQQIAEKAGFRAIVVNGDRTSAIVGTNLASGVGDLVRVDLASGAVTPIAKGVSVLATADAEKEFVLRGSTELAFSVSPDGAHVAFSDRAPAVHLWSKGKVTDVAPMGRFPAVSPDGKSVAYHSGSNMVVWSGGKTLTTQPSAGLIVSKWSPDSRYLAYLTKYQPRGIHSLFGTTIGDVSVWKVGGKAPMPWATDAAWQTLTYGPDKGASTALSLLGDLRDLSEVATLDRGVGTVLAGAPDAAPMVLARKVRPDVVKHFPISGGVAFTGTEDPFQAGSKYTAYTWKPGTKAAKELIPSAMEGSLITGEVLPAGSKTDDLLLMTNPAEKLFDNLALVGALQAVPVNKPPKKLLDHAFLITFTTDGHVLALAPAPDGSSNADVWLLPMK